ncbi:Acetyltransferase (GNAT) family protein [Rhizobiales bacterium GAS188]|nr:Acetyltransferase (GNAT) family protein [Rhizobiales bacterium GAS188]
MTTPKIEPPCPIAAAHDRTPFGCGNPVLDDWLKQRALSSEGRSARTYVLCSGETVIGYYCLATGAEKRVGMPKKIRQGNPDPVPLIIIGRLAVDSRFHGQGLGAALLKDALTRAAAASEIVGARAVLVHAIDDRAVAFYAKAQFVEFPGGSRRPFLPIETLLAAISKE